MTEKNDIEALREAAIKATKGRWMAFSDDGSKTYAVHTPNDKRCENIVKWAGFDCQKNAKANAEFIALANPVTIIALLDQLEAERQQREAAEAEIAALRGEQEPVAFLIHEKARPSRLSFRNLKGFVSDADIAEHELWQEPLFTRQPKPVVVVLSFEQWCEGREENPLWWVREAMRDAYNGALETVSIVVKDGE